MTAPAGRLNRQSIGLVFKTGRSVGNRYWAVKFVTGRESGGWAVVVPKRLVPRAVDRNFIKRRVRHVWRRLQPRFLSGAAAVILARQSAVRDLPFGVFERELVGLLKQTKLI